MSTNLYGASAAPPTIRLVAWDFKFMGRLAPERDKSGSIMELSPQGHYAKADTVALHKHGDGFFCRFRIAVPAGLVGVYALVVDEVVHYIGECQDLSKRFNMGYGNISPKNCYVGGQSTNCKINRRVLDVSKAGGHVDLYFQPTPLRERKMIEKQLLVRLSPPWNGWLDRGPETVRRP